MVNSAHDIRQSHLLAALPETVHKRLDRFLELTTMPLGDVLYESGRPLSDVFFPDNLHRVVGLRDGG